MRKVNMTKQNIIKPKALFMGLSIRQIVIMAIGLLVSLGVFALLYFVLGASVDLALIPVFLILILFGAGSIAQINGSSALAWLLIIMKGNITRHYESKGVFDRYEEYKWIRIHIRFKSRLQPAEHGLLR